MSEEQFKFFDLGHWIHTKFNGYEEVGKTVYNVDCGKTRRVLKTGQAPCEMLSQQMHWFSVADVVKTLLGLGFKQRNEVEFWR